MTIAGGISRGLGLLSLIALAACDVPPPVAPIPDTPPVQRPEDIPIPFQVPVVLEPSEASV